MKNVLFDSQSGFKGNLLTDLTDYIKTKNF